MMMMMMCCLSWWRFQAKPRHLPYMCVCVFFFHAPFSDVRIGARPTDDDSSGSPFRETVPMAAAACCTYGEKVQQHGW